MRPDEKERVLAAVETDPREQELLAGAAAQIFGRLKVEWTLDLLSSLPVGLVEAADSSEA